MNLLTQYPPTEIEVDGIFYPVDAHYRNCLTILAAFEDMELTRGEQQRIMVERLFTKVPDHPDSKIPRNITAAANAAIDFLNCGEALNVSEEGRIYSFSHDAKYIRSAIEKSHRINLEEVGFLHWWKFIYLFFDLDENCFFNRLIGLRQKRKRPDGLTKEEKEYIRKNPEIINIPEPVDPEVQNARDDFFAQLGGDIDG